MNDIDIQKIREAAKGAKRLPYIASVHGGIRHTASGFKSLTSPVAEVHDEPTRSFLVLAANNILPLCDEVERLRKERDEVIELYRKADRLYEDAFGSGEAVKDVRVSNDPEMPPDPPAASIAAEEAWCAFTRKMDAITNAEAQR